MVRGKVKPKLCDNCERQETLTNRVRTWHLNRGDFTWEVDICVECEESITLHSAWLIARQHSGGHLRGVDALDALRVEPPVTKKKK